ncbi:hypothetical protein CEXT_142391, partial [Caerostris extrusa]
LLKSSQFLAARPRGTARDHGPAAVALCRGRKEAVSEMRLALISEYLFVFIGPLGAESKFEYEIEPLNDVLITECRNSDSKTLWCGWKS